MAGIGAERTDSFVIWDHGTCLGFLIAVTKSVREMQLPRTCAGLRGLRRPESRVVCRPAPVVALAGHAGLDRLVADTLSVSGRAGARAEVKVGALAAGMVAGADSIEDLDLLRRGRMARLFSGLRPLTTLGAFLRRFAFGHMRQFDAVAGRLLAGLARGSATPACRA